MTAITDRKRSVRRLKQNELENLLYFTSEISHNAKPVYSFSRVS